MVGNSPKKEDGKFAPPPLDRHWGYPEGPTGFIRCNRCNQLVDMTTGRKCCG